MLVATCMVRSVDEKRQFEQQFISELKPKLNMCRAFRTEEELKEDNRISHQKSNQNPEVKAKRKEYYAKPEYKVKQKEYRTKYRDKPEVRQQQKEYKQIYNESIRRTCICGVRYMPHPSKANTHYNTKHHIDYVADFQSRLATLLEKK